MAKAMLMITYNIWRNNENHTFSVNLFIFGFSLHGHFRGNLFLGTAELDYVGKIIQHG